MKRLLLITFFNLLLIASYGQTIYVDADATGANNGTSWTDAFTSLQSALPSATATKPIWVATGTYKPHVSDRSIAFSPLTGTLIYGGFNGTETLLSQRNPTLNVTILSGDLLGNDNVTIINTEPTRQDNSYNIIKIQSAAANVTIDGVTITGANGNGAPGVTNSGAVVLNAGLYISITTFFNDVIFEKNSAVESAVFRGFTPAANGSSSIVEFNVTNSILRYNVSGTTANCDFVGTHVNVWSQNSNDRVSGGFKNTLFHNNSSVGAASCINNRVNGGSGSFSPLNVFNCTFTENTGTNDRVISLQNATTSKYKNNIIFGNGALTPIYMLNSGPIATTWSNCIINDAVFGLNQNPLFRDAPNKDYRMDCSGNSPAINAGTLSGVSLPSTDLAGNSRVVNTVDIGCYEYRSVITVTPTSSTVCNGSSVTFSSLNGTGTTWSNGIVEGVPYFPTITQTVTATGTNENNCLQVVPVTLTVPVIADLAVTPTPSTICTGGSATISVANSETDIYYSLVNDATDVLVMGATQGNGSTLNFNLTGITSTTTYHVNARKYLSTINGALDLDGVNDYVNLGTANRGMTATATVSLKIKTSVTPAANQYILSKYNGTNGITMYIDPTGKIVFYGRDGGVVRTSGPSTTTITDNQWHDITGVVRSSGWEIYVDGVMQNSGAYPLNTGISNATNFNIGNYSTSYSPIDIDNLSVWGTALSSAQILANINTCLVGNEANLTGLFRFNEAAGTTVTDNSVTATNGTLVNMTVPGCWIAGPIDACAQFCDRELTQLATVTVDPAPSQPTISASGSTSLCSGGSVTLTASAGTTYLWSTGATSASIVVSTAGTYTVQVTNAAGCQSVASAGTIVIVGTLPAQPTITAGGSTTFCTGGSVTLTSSTGTSYLWSNGATTAAISPTTSATYTVQVTNASGCQSVASLGTTVTVNTLPTQPTISAGGPTTFCTGGSVTLTASTGTSYLWSTGATTAAISPSTAGTFTVQVTNAAGCQSIASTGTTVSVNTLPSQPTISAGGPTTFCAGGSVTLTASAGTTYLWSTGATIAAISPTTAGTYTVQITNAAGCLSIASLGTAVTVNALPSQPTITAGGPTTFCSGGSVTLTSSTGTSYFWSNGASATSTNITTSGTYTLQVTNAFGCMSIPSAGTLVTVNALPAQPTIAAGGPTTFCTGGSVTLTASVGSGYLWSDGSMSPSINVSSASTYTVQVTNAAGCQSVASTSTVVTVNTLPNAPIISPNAPTTFCDGGTVNLASSAGISYLWSNGATTSAIDLTTGGTFTVQVTGPNGCQSLPSAPTTVVVNPNPIISSGTVSNPTSCTVDNGSIQVNGTGTGTISWTGASSGSLTAVTLPATISNLGDGGYLVTFTNTSICVSNTLNVALSAPSAPSAPSISAGGPTTFCAGGSVTLTASTGSSYLWSNGETTANIVATMAGNYTVTITDASGCSSPSSSATAVTLIDLPVISTGTLTNPSSCTVSDGSIEVLGTETGDLNWTGTSAGSLTGITLPVIVNGLANGNYSFTFTAASGCVSLPLSGTLTLPSAPPAPIISAGGSTTLCEGDLVSLTSTSGDSYLWSNGATTQSIDVDLPGTYTVTVTDLAGCTSPTSAGTVVVVNAIPSASTTVSGITITATNASATYQWIDCGNSNQAIAGATSQSFTPTANGSYAVIVTQNNCSDTSACTPITTVGIDTHASLIDLRLQPNPTSNEVTIVSDLSIEKVEIYTTSGQLVQVESTKSFTVGQLTTGVYLVKVFTVDGNSTLRLIKN